jgi:tetratricopeptide (TPR) repeat protein
MRSIGKMLFILPERGILPVFVGKWEFAAVNVLSNQLTLNLTSPKSNRTERKQNLIQVFEETSSLQQKIHYLNLLIDENILLNDVISAEDNLRMALEFYVGHLKELTPKTTEWFSLSSVYVESLTKKAMLQQMKGHLEESIITYKKALSLKIEITENVSHFANWPCQANLAIAHLVLEQYTQALKIYENYPKILTPRLGIFAKDIIDEGAINRGVINFFKNELEVAEKIFLSALKESPQKMNMGSAIAQSNLSILYFKMKDISAADKFSALAENSFSKLIGTKYFDVKMTQVAVASNEDNPCIRNF